MNAKRADRTHVPPRQAAFAKTMRRELTEPERKLWKALRLRLPIDGTHFRRQVPLGSYIADFCSHRAKLVIEVDGNQHGDDQSIARDAIRTAQIEAQGYRVLRFSNSHLLAAMTIGTSQLVDTLRPNLANTGNHGPLKLASTVALLLYHPCLHHRCIYISPHAEICTIR